MKRERGTMWLLSGPYTIKAAAKGCHDPNLWWYPERKHFALYCHVAAGHVARLAIPWSALEHAVTKHRTEQLPPARRGGRGKKK